MSVWSALPHSARALDHYLTLLLLRENNGYLTSEVKNDKIVHCAMSSDSELSHLEKNPAEWDNLASIFALAKVFVIR